MKNRAFTLIEVIIYIALFAILMGGAIISAYGLFQSSDNNQTKAMVQDEGDFLLAKFEWALSDGVSSVATSTDASGSQVDVLPLNSTAHRIIAITGSDMSINTTGTWLVLNNSNVTVSQSTDPTNGTLVPYFALTAATPDVSKHVKESFTLTSRSADGQTVSQSFTITGYIH